MEARLIFITDVARFGESETLRVAERLCRAARPGSIAIQLRDKQLAVRERLALALRLRELTRAADQYLLVNERLDLAVLSDADGVHLGEQGLEPASVRERFPSLFISCAWHAGTPRAGADAYLLSPVLEERKGVAALGLSGLRQHAERDPGRRIYALGGVSTSNALDCLQSGAFGVALIGAAYAAPEALITALALTR